MNNEDRHLSENNPEYSDQLLQKNGNVWQITDLDRFVDGLVDQCLSELI
jgi:hypothetical protein